MVDGEFACDHLADISVNVSYVRVQSLEPHQLVSDALRQRAHRCVLDVPVNVTFLVTDIATKQLSKCS